MAAARLVAAGYEVVGVTLHLWDYPNDESVRGRCCAPEDIYDARRVADTLGFSHYTFDRREVFERTVVSPFVEAYLAGATPSPCVRCNRGVKMPELFRLAERLGASRVATGHYARTGERNRRMRLLRALDHQKDQSYFLYALGEDSLRRLLFPMGERTKADVRSEGLALGLFGADKGESQELCFVPSGRYDDFVRRRAGDRVRPGFIVDDEGRRVGSHDGVFGFTVGQRKNLGVALGKRAYVVALEPDTATVRLGSRDDLGATGALLEDVVLASGVELPFTAEVSVRYHARPVRARVIRGESGVELGFEEPVFAVVPGQAAVFYEGDEVLGGGTILRATGRSESPVITSLGGAP